MVLRSWPFEIGDAIDVARAADLLVKHLRIADVVGVNPVAAHADGAEFLVANGDRRGGAPALVGLHARGEVIDVRFERRLERLVPIHQVGEDRQCLRVQRVEAGREDVGDSALVYEHRHLGIANRELAAVLDLHVLHGITVGQDSIFRFGPLDDIDELLGKETHKLVPEYTAESGTLFPLLLGVGG